MGTLIIILAIFFVIYELIEHVAFPLFWSLVYRKKKPLYGPERILGETGEVKEWKEKEGYVFVDGELWKAVSEVKLKIGNKVAIQKMEGLTLTVTLLKFEDQLANSQRHAQIFGVAIIFLKVETIFNPPV